MCWSERILTRALFPILMLCLWAGVLHGQTTPAAKAKESMSKAAKEQDWWRNAVIYEIYPRSFQDTNGDGIGDLNGITQRLDYLKELGVDAIWLTPIYPSPQVDFGYDISDYKAIDPQYGTMEDFDRLVAEAKKHQIRVVMDMVMNHTSDQHKWFLESRSSRTNPYRDWYVWHDPKPGGGPPNNWQALFGHSAWEWDEKTGQYYYHFFYKQQPDLNWYNPKVHEAFKDTLRFWLDKGVGGFRFDAITNLFEDSTLADEEPIKDASGKVVINAYGDPSLEVTRQDNLPGVHTVVHEMRAVCDSFGSDHFPGTRVMIGETYLPNIAELAKMYGTPKAPEFELPMDTQIGFINKLDVAAFRRVIDDAEERINGNTPLIVFTNHDNPRLDLRYGDGVHDIAITRVLSTILFATRGSSLFYYGDEIGMKTTPPTRKEDVKDPIGIIGWPKEKGRDGERTPMQWDATPNSGFSTGKPWLPIPSSAAQVNVAAQKGDPNSLFNWYKALIALKKTNPALAGGSYVELDPENAHVLSWARVAPTGEQVVVSVNFTAEPQTVNLADGAKLRTHHARTLLKSPDGGEPDSLDAVKLAPFGVYIGEVK
jgi:alpha-glucosidase